MSGYDCDCEVKGIPLHLHAKGKPLLNVSSNDRLFIRVPAIPKESIYGFDIQGFRYLNQSANSEELNKGGVPCDVLWNVHDGSRFDDHEVACIPVSELRSLEFPNPNVVKLGKDGVELPVSDDELYRFEVHHDPVPCMYPHCEIGTYQGGERKTRLNSNEVKSLIRRAFAKIADKYRAEMVDIMESHAARQADHPVEKT